MPDPKLKTLPVEKLRKKRTAALWILILILIVTVLSFAVLIYVWIRDGVFSIELAVPVLGCVAAGLPMYMGIKQIDKELAKRIK